MSSERDKLHATLQALHEELLSADSLDDETRRLLADVLADIQAKIGIRAETGELEPHPQIAHLKQLVERFEDSHPTLTRLIGNIVDALGQIGI